MNNKVFWKSQMFWIIIIIIIVIITVITIIMSKSLNKINNNSSSNEDISGSINQMLDTTDNTIKNEIIEEVANKELPKIELNKITKENSTIDGKVPCFYNPVIPTGFKAVGNTQDETIDKNADWNVYNGYLYGLVIEDEKGNQFVWIPVENMDLFKTTDWQKNVARETIDSNYVEPLNSEKDEYNKMYSKVKKYGGFYVGRYETGDITANSERITVKNSDSIGIKKNLNTYNYVPFKQSTIDNREITGAKELAIKFAKDNNYKNITTSVMYGVQWDYMLRYVVSDTYNVNDSIKWGNYSTSELQYTDVQGNTYTKRAGEVRLLKAGTSEQTKVKNIYDIAGNCYEWTIESSGNNVRIVRGGSYVVAIGQLAAARYAYGENTANNAIGFRISFYID